MYTNLSSVSFVGLTCISSITISSILLEVWENLNVNSSNFHPVVFKEVGCNSIRTINKIIILALILKLICEGENICRTHQRKINLKNSDCRPITAEDFKGVEERFIGYPSDWFFPHEWKWCSSSTRLHALSWHVSYELFKYSSFFGDLFKHGSIWEEHWKVRIVLNKSW